TDLATLKAGLVKVVVKFNMKGATIVDQRQPVQGAPVTNTYGPLEQTYEFGVHPGSHTFRARLAGYPDVSWEFEGPPGSSQTHEFVFEAKKDQAGGPVAEGEKVRPVPKYVWIAGGASAAVLAGGVVTGILALGKKSEFNTANTGTDPSKANELKSSG